MRPAARVDHLEHAALPQLRELADRMFSRAAGAPLIGGNQVRLLEDGARKLPRVARSDSRGEGPRSLRKLLHPGRRNRARSSPRLSPPERAKASACESSTTGWAASARLRAGSGGGSGRRASRFGVYNPPRLSSPLGWISRDHRKTLIVDGAIGFVTGLCVGRTWVGDPARNIAPWRDTGVEIRGPAVAEIARAFARSWALAGPPLPDDRLDP